MSAETLRRAASSMRHDVAFGQPHGNGAVLLALAHLLDEQAAQWEVNYEATQQPSRGVDEPPAINYGNPRAAALNADWHARHALAVARAHLGEPT